ncbi:MAG TPA: hypothetical protein PLD56_12605 [Chitinophagales bacterium]|nr:hypothetical protein [Chitinophagales bacterium]
MKTKKQNDLEPREKWNSMSLSERVDFFKRRSVDDMFIMNNMGKQFDELPSATQYALKSYMIPKKTNKMIKKKINFSINSNKINSFLNSINDAEFIYLEKCVSLAYSIKNIIKEYDLTNERFCTEMGINKKQLKNYISGGRNYDLKDIAKLNALAYKLYMENAEKNAELRVPVKTPIRTYSKNK